MIKKIKDFNLKHFKRILLGKSQLSIDTKKLIFILNAKRKTPLSEEDEDIKNTMINYLNKNKENIFKISSQEEKFLEANKSKISTCQEYLIYRYKVRVLPGLKKLSSFPAYLLIEPVSSCNLRCVMCFQSGKTFTKKPFMGVMSLKLFKKIVDEAVLGGTKAITLASRGEPTMNKQLPEMLRYAEGKFFEVKVNTNATRLTEQLCHDILSSGVSELVFSIDAENKELYERIRVKGNFEKVIDNIRMFHRVRDEHYPNSLTTTTASGVFFDEDQDIDKFRAFFEKIVDQVAYVSIENRWNTYTNETHPEIEKPCDYLWQRMYIWFDGKCNPCDVDYKSYLKVGNISENTIKDIWNGEVYQRLRKDHNTGSRSKHSPCDRCGVA